MAFENASVTKGLMLGIALTTITVGIFDVKHYTNLQLIPHISKYYQYWRLFTYHLACANSSDLFLIELLLYNIGMHIERSFGSVKYASFIIVTTLVSTITIFLCLLTLQMSRYLGSIFNNLQSGPICLMFGILYQYTRLVPQGYQFKVFGAVVSDKVWIYVLAAQGALLCIVYGGFYITHWKLGLPEELDLRFFNVLIVSQLAISQLPSSLLPAFIGLLSGCIYRSDILQLKGWRIPHRLQTFAKQWFQPLLEEGRATRRSTRVFLETRVGSRTSAPALSETEVVTTAQQPLPTAPNAAEAARERFRDRMQDRRRTEDDIRNLMVMFPDVRRAVITDVVRRSPNIEAAAALLLSSRA